MMFLFEYLHPRNQYNLPDVRPDVLHFSKPVQVRFPQIQIQKDLEEMYGW